MTAEALTEAMMNPGIHLSGRLKPAFVQSLVFHVTLVGGLTAWAWWNLSDGLGSKDTGTPMVGVIAVNDFPLPSRGPENKVANPSDSDRPQTKPERLSPKEIAKPEPPEAIPIPSVSKPTKVLRPTNALPSFKDLEKDQLPSKTPQRLSLPDSQPKGASEVGTSLEAVMGTKFGAYATLIKEIMTQQWHEKDLDRSAAGIPVTVRYTIQKNGKVTGFQFVRRSQNAALDESVQHAIEDAHFPPLPDGYPKTSVEVESKFELKR